MPTARRGAKMARPCAPWGVFPIRFQDALVDGTPIDRADGTALDLSETEALAAWRAGVALVVRS